MDSKTEDSFMFHAPRPIGTSGKQIVDCVPLASSPLVRYPQLAEDIVRVFLPEKENEEAVTCESKFQKTIELCDELKKLVEPSLACLNSISHNTPPKSPEEEHIRLRGTEEMSACSHTSNLWSLFSTRNDPSGDNKPKDISRSKWSKSFSSSEKGRFRNYKADLWSQKYRDLVQYRQQNGHCEVPNNYSANPSLACWVRRQRFNYKQKKRGVTSSSCLTDDREAALERLGFVWDAHNALWMERFHELTEYRAIHGDSHVSASDEANSRLATWVKCQRRQYKLFKAGRHSNMTKTRIGLLDSIGFVWSFRRREMKH